MKINSAQFLPLYSSGELLLDLLYVSWITLIHGLTWEVSNLTVYSFVMICMTKHFIDMELKQPWRLWRRKRHLRSQLALSKLQLSYSTSFNLSNDGELFWCQTGKDYSVYLSCSLALCYPPPYKGESKKPHVVIIQRRQRNTHKSEMHRYNLLYATLNLLFFIVSVVIFVV